MAELLLARVAVGQSYCWPELLLPGLLLREMLLPAAAPLSHVHLIAGCHVRPPDTKHTSASCASYLEGEVASRYEAQSPRVSKVCGLLGPGTIILEPILRSKIFQDL